MHVLPQGVLADQAMNVVTFSVVSGAGRLSGTHSGDAASNEPAHGSSKRAYHGLVRAFIRRCHTAKPRTCALMRSRGDTHVANPVGEDTKLYALMMCWGLDIRSTSDHATPLEHRLRMRSIDLDGGALTSVSSEAAGVDLAMAPIVVTASVPGLPPATLEIPLSADPSLLPLAVASRPEAHSMLA